MVDGQYKGVYGHQSMLHFNDMAPEKCTGAAAYQASMATAETVALCLPEAFRSLHHLQGSLPGAASDPAIRDSSLVIKSVALPIPPWASRIQVRWSLSECAYPHTHPHGQVRGHCNGRRLISAKSKSKATPARIKSTWFAPRLNCGSGLAKAGMLEDVVCWAIVRGGLH